MEKSDLGRGEINANLPPNFRNLTKHDYLKALKKLNIEGLTPIIMLFPEIKNFDFSKVNKDVKNPTKLEIWLLELIQHLQHKNS